MGRNKKKGYRERIMIDTHIFLDYLNNRSNLNDYVLDLLDDVNVEKVISVESLREMIIKFRTGKLEQFGWEKAVDILQTVEETGYTILPITEDVIYYYSQLYINIAQNHKDSSDHIIICHSMVEHCPLVAHDGKYDFYIEQGLDLIYGD